MLLINNQFVIDNIAYDDKLLNSDLNSKYASIKSDPMNGNIDLQERRRHHCIITQSRQRTSRETHEILFKKYQQIYWAKL